MKKLSILLVIVFLSSALYGQLKVFSSGGISLGSTTDPGSGKVAVNGDLSTTGLLYAGWGFETWGANTLHNATTISGVTHVTSNLYADANLTVAGYAYLKGTTYFEDYDYIKFGDESDGNRLYSYGDYLVMDQWGSDDLRFWITDEIAATCIYSYNIYLGSAAGNNINFRSNLLNGDYWLIDQDGYAQFDEIYETSDIKLKENIEPLPAGSLSKITSLNGIHYNMIRDTTKALRTGLSAQEVQTIFPELVRENEHKRLVKEGEHPELDEYITESHLSLNYDGLIPYLVEAIKEQQSLIESMQSEIEALRSMVR